MKRIKLKDLLNETPDTVVFRDKEIAREIARYSDSSAQAFFVAEDYTILGKKQSTYHLDIIVSLRALYRKFMSDFYPEKTKKNLKHAYETFDDYNSIDEPIIITNTDNLYIDLKTPSSGLYEIVNDNHPPTNPRIIRGLLSGRIWPDKKIISFWQDKNEVVPKWYFVENMFKDLNLNIGEFQIDFMDRVGNIDKPLETIDTLKKKTDAEFSEETKQKMLDILSKLHTAAPEKKKEMLNKIGANTPSKINKLAQKLGFNSVAEFYHYTKLDENVPLKEDPDNVYVVTDIDGSDGSKVEKTYHYLARDARAFAVFKNFSIKTSYNDVHAKIDTFLYEAASVIENIISAGKINSPEYIIANLNSTLDAYKLDCTDVEELGKFIGDRVSRVLAKKISVRSHPEVLAGRLWLDGKVMSFWNRKEDVVKMWPEVVQMFKDFNYSLHKYEIDFLEREDDERIPLYPASKISAGEKVEPEKVYKDDDDLGLDFLDKLFPDEQDPLKKLKTLKSDELEKIREKLHLMDPIEKQKFAKKIYSMKNKAAELADSLGFNSVAQMNALTKLDERTEHRA
jgi:hypothetical protein